MARTRAEAANGRATDAKINQIKKEVDAEMANPPFGVEADRMSVFVGDKKSKDCIRWKINPDGHIKRNRDIIMQTIDTYETDFKKANTRLQKEKIHEHATKTILELGLVNFEYDKWANHVKVGPVVLHILAEELQNFLVENGGSSGFQFWLTLQKANILTRYNSGQTE